jgi:hypothetical protein
MKPINLRLAITFLALCLMAPPASSQVKKCRAADETSAGLILELKDWVTTTDSTRVRLRSTVYELPAGITASQIVLSIDEKICAKAITAYTSISGGYIPASLYVIELGSKGYAILDPTDTAGEYRMLMFLNTKYVRVGGWTG